MNSYLLDLRNRGDGGQQALLVVIRGDCSQEIAFRPNALNRE